MWPEGYTFRESDPRTLGAKQASVCKLLALTPDPRCPLVAVQEGGVFAAKLTFVSFATEQALVLTRSVLTPVALPLTPRHIPTPDCASPRTFNLDTNLG